MLSNLTNWISAFRLRTLPLALSSMVMGGALAYMESKFNFTIFILSCITTILLQILSNLANDYGDFMNGGDTDLRKGPARMVQSGKISPKKMFSALLFCSFIALITGFLLLIVTFPNLGFSFWILFFVGLSAIGAAIKYTAGSNPYGYRGLGDFFVFLFFGIIGVIGSSFLYVKELQFCWILPAFSIGLLSTAVLNINNIRDIKSDSSTGKNTIPVKIGLKNAIIYHVVLCVSSLLCLLIFSVIVGNYYLLLIQLFFLYFRKIYIEIILHNQDVEIMNLCLKKTALGTFALSVLFFVLVFVNQYALHTI